jgi:hypothetical protein
MINSRRFCLFLVMVTMLAAPVSAGTVLWLTLDDVSLIGSLDSSVTFSGLIQNTSGSDVYLNGASANLSYSELTFDPTPFLTLAPLVLADGDFYSGPLFSIAISEVAIVGDYPGTFIIQGGADPSTFDTVASADFQVSVATVPEPPSAQLLGITALFVCAVFYKLKRTKLPYPF